MQRRLFLFFLLLSLVPALAILAVNWQISQRHLGFLDSPGLGDALESSLELARGELNRRLDRARAELANLTRAWGGDPRYLPLPDDDGVLVLLRDGLIVRAVGALDPELEPELRALAASGHRGTVRIEAGGSEWVVATADAAQGVLVLAHPLEPELTRNLEAVAQGGARIRQLRLYYGDLLRGDTLATLLVLGLVVLLVALLLSRILARRVTSPLRALADGTRRIAEGDLDHRVQVDAPDELGQLVDAFNRMTDQLRTSQEDLIQAERTAAWRGVARRLAHEIKNPLTPITLAMHRIGKRVEDETVADSVRTVLEETENLKRLADEFSQYARLPDPRPEPADLGDLARTVLELYADRERLEVVWKCEAETLPVRIDPGQVRQALANLVKNAIAAMDGTGRLTVTLARRDGEAVCAIADSGAGLPDPPGRVFEPYYTTKATGTGLGLPISRRIVEDQRGTLTAANGRDGGAVFRLALPLDPAPNEEETA